MWILEYSVNDGDMQTLMDAEPHRFQGVLFDEFYNSATERLDVVIRKSTVEEVTNAVNNPAREVGR